METFGSPIFCSKTVDECQRFCYTDDGQMFGDTERKEENYK